MWKDVTMFPVDHLVLLQEAGLLWYQFVTKDGEPTAYSVHRLEYHNPAEQLQYHRITWTGVVVCGEFSETFYRWYIREE